MQVDVYTKDGQNAGPMELDDDVFSIEPSEYAMHQSVVIYLAHQRQGTRATKTRAYVSGGGKKPWRQKGRGTARAGSTRSPLWVGGGTIHGPQPHKFNLKISKKLNRLARRSALSMRVYEKNLVVVEDFILDEVKTKQMAAVINNLQLQSNTLLVLTPEVNYDILRAARNIPGVSVFPAEQISAYDILRHKKLLVFKSAVEKITNGLKN